MYNFIDVNEVSEGALLPSEALQINGEFIENLIQGYRTLSVSGREGLSAEIDSYETGAMDGARIKNKRFPARTIIVKYQIKTESNEAFRRAYNKLASILDTQNATLVFNDETDKFFIGTPYEMGEIEQGTNAVVGEFSIYCANPFKYSVQEYTATAEAGENSILIDYRGAYKAYPILEADFYKESEGDEGTGTLTGAGDCGFVSFFTDDEKIIQLGNPDEVDAITGIAQSQTLMNQPFNTSGAWSTSNNLWSVNSGISTPLTTAQVGQPGMKTAKFATATPTNTSGLLLNKQQTVSNTPYTYNVTAKTSSRTASSVKVTITVALNLYKALSSYGSIFASVYMGGSWHNVSFAIGENTTYYPEPDYIGNPWPEDLTPAPTDTSYEKPAPDPTTHFPGMKTYSASVSFTVSGLSASTKSLTGILFKANRMDSPDLIGYCASTNCSNLPISTYEAPIPSSYYLTASGYGTGSGWHGAVITRDVPADAAGVTGATNFKLSYSQIMGANSKNEIGAFQMILSDAAGVKIAAVATYKNKTGTTGNIVFYVDGVKVYGTERDLSYTNQFFGATAKSSKSTVIQKSGNKIIFNVGGIQQTFTSSVIANRAVTKLTFVFAQWGTNTPLAYNGIYNLKFVKNNCDDVKDIPNKFSANDILEADCNTGEIRLNNVVSPDLGALGNDWEKFYLKPGLNMIGFAYSDWVASEYAPEFKVRYREVFI